MIKAPKMETDRLLLTWPSPEQITQYYEDIINTTMFDTIMWDGPQSKDDLPNYWTEAKKTDPNNFDQELNFGIIKKETNEMIGGFSYRPVDSDRHVVNIGFAFAPKFHNQGYATQAVRAFVHEAFLNRGAMRVFGTVFVGNEASKRVFEKLDFTLEGTLRGVALKRGEWKDEWILGITKSDWEQSKVY